MSTFELAGEAMLQMQEGNRGFALALGRFLSGVFSKRAPETALLGSPSFFQQEPDLAKETHLPGTYTGTV